MQVFHVRPAGVERLVVDRGDPQGYATSGNQRVFRSRLAQADVRAVPVGAVAFFGRCAVEMGEVTGGRLFHFAPDQLLQVGMRAYWQGQDHAFDIRELPAEANFAIDGNEMADETHGRLPLDGCFFGPGPSPEGHQKPEAYAAHTSNVRRFRHKVTPSVTSVTRGLPSDRYVGPPQPVVAAGGRPVRNPPAVAG